MNSEYLVTSLLATKEWIKTIDVKIELVRLIKIQVKFVVSNQFVNRVRTCHHEWVDTWYHKYQKVCIRSDLAIVYIMII